MVFHPKIATSQNKDERLCKERGLEGVSSLILDYEAVRMNADGLHLSREISRIWKLRLKRSGNTS